MITTFTQATSFRRTRARTDEESFQTRMAFDAVAATYDTQNEALPGIRRIREHTRRLYLQYFARGSRLLELNCGTGNDAVFLAQHGMKILATDLSPLMLEEVRKKTLLAGLAATIETREVSFERLGDLHGSSFEGVFSNMGGLNCTRELPQIAADLAPLVKPGKYFVATVMPPFCLAETLVFLAGSRWPQAFRRTSGKNGSLAHLGEGVMRTFYHSPRAFARAFAPHFEHVKTIGLLVLLPPPNFARAYSTFLRRAKFLKKLDESVSKLPFFRSIGDHYIMVLRRKSNS